MAFFNFILLLIKDLTECLGPVLLFLWIFPLPQEDLSQTYVYTLPEYLVEPFTVQDTILLILEQHSCLKM